MARRATALARVPRPWEQDAGAELEALRAAVRARYSEADLVVAALKEHVRDLQLERKRLATELAHLRETRRREQAAWMWRGSKGVKRTED